MNIVPAWRDALRDACRKAEVPAPTAARLPAHGPPLRLSAIRSSREVEYDLARIYLVRASQAATLVRGKPLPQVRPEFLPEVRDESSRQAVGHAHRRLPARRHARGEPAILDDIADHVPRESSPRGREMPVTSGRQGDGRRRIAEARPGSMATRPDISRILTPEAAETGLNRIGNTASGRAIGVATAESPPVLVPFLRPVALGHPRTVEDTHADGGDGNRPPHNPGHAFCCGDGRVGAAPLLVRSARLRQGDNRQEDDDNSDCTADA